MNERRETGMAWLMAIVIAALAALMLMASCKTSKVITENVYEHDTVEVHHSDTVREVVYKAEKDSVIEKEVHTYTLNNVGDTVKEIHHYHNTEKVIVVDTTYRYRAERDSLRQALRKEKAREKTVKPSRSSADYLIIAALIMIIIIVVLKGKSH